MNISERIAQRKTLCTELEGMMNKAKPDTLGAAVALIASRLYLAEVTAVPVAYMGTFQGYRFRVKVRGVNAFTIPAKRGRVFAIHSTGHK